MVGHSWGVTKNLLEVENTLDRGYWDDVFREKSYYENQDSPVEEPMVNGREVGEFDVLAVNYEDKVAMATEVKENFASESYGAKQKRRMQAEFEDSEWDLLWKSYTIARDKRSKDRVAAD